MKGLLVPLLVCAGNKHKVQPLCVAGGREGRRQQNQSGASPGIPGLAMDSAGYRRSWRSYTPPNTMRTEKNKGKNTDYGPQLATTQRKRSPLSAKGLVPDASTAGSEILAGPEGPPGRTG